MSMPLSRVPGSRRDMAHIGREAVLRRNPRVVSREMEGSSGALLLHLDSAAYHSLNRTGALIWGVLDQPTDVGRLLEILDREMGDGTVLQAEILTYLEELAGRGLVEVEEPAGS